MQTSDAERTSVALLALPETTPAALYGLYEVFVSVGTAWGAFTGERTGVAPMDVRIVTADGRPVLSPLGMEIVPGGALGAADVVIAGDLAFGPGFDPRGRWPVETAWLRERHEAGAIVASICTGALVLAEAGLLDERVATTHWLAAPILGTCYPGVRLEAGRVLAQGDPEGRVLTSGGAAAWEDLALHLVARLRGGAEAVRIARLFLFGDRSEGQHAHAPPRPARRHEDAAVADAQEWIAANYAAAKPVAAMAARSGLAERTFKRRFLAATGYAPLDYVQAVRIEEAKQMLVASDMTADEIAAEVGYEDAAFFRRLFKRRTGTTPAGYRRRFARIARSA